MAKSSPNDPAVKQESESGARAAGIAKNRGCTDIICLFIYFAHLGLFGYLASVGFYHGDWRRTVLPTDFASQVCGSENNLVTPRIPLSNFSDMAWNMNVPNTIGEGALDAICDHKSNVLQMSGCEPTTACGFNLEKACKQRKSSGKFNPLKFLEPEEMGKWIKGFGLDFNPLDQFDKYILASCVSSCRDVANFLDKTIPDKEAPRTYIYTPHKSSLIAEAWEKAKTDTAFRKIANQFEFKAFPTSICPYDAEYCIGFPGSKVNKVLKRCMLDFDSIAAAVENKNIKEGEKKEDLKSKVTDALRDAIGSSFGEAIATAANTWEVFLIVAVASLVIGIICLVLLRFTAGLWIWASIMIFFCGIISAGIYAFWYSSACAGIDLLDDIGDRATNYNLEGKACPNGYLEPGENLRMTYRYVSFGIFIVAGIFLLLICCLNRQIREAVSLNKVAARFVACNKSTLFVPVTQILIVTIWWVFWFFVIAFVISNVPIVDGVYSYNDAVTAPDKPGNCTSTWPSGTAWEDKSLKDCSCMGIKDCDPASLPCYRCGPPRFSISWEVAVLFFSLLWNNGFVVAIGQMTIAGAVAVWYFNHGRGLHVTPVSTGLWNSFRYHPGSAAFGAFILAVVKFIKWWLRFLAKQSQAQGNVVAARIAACLSYCVACFERFIKFLNKNAYIICAISGKNFCSSARESLSLVVRNAGRYMAVGSVTTMLQLLGVLFITGGTGASGYFILKAIHPEVPPWFCFAFYLLMGYIVGKLCLNVYTIAVSCALVCFIMDGENNNEPLFAPKEMHVFYKNQKERLSNDKS